MKHKHCPYYEKMRELLVFITLAEPDQRTPDFIDRVYEKANELLEEEKK